ncbi:hypothetical protein NPIL_635461 [Nephila pilipes]|uniref:Uncharacterized protein n=1 Tax=Nephila pilipes TaxID=299642 RepID=A0A8X6PQ18_NEPPI|nr:hypothetical protein NPIL_635461 [Nephila pilipes]
MSLKANGCAINTDFLSRKQTVFNRFYTPPQMFYIKGFYNNSYEMHVKNITYRASSYLSLKLFHTSTDQIMPPLPNLSATCGMAPRTLSRDGNFLAIRKTCIMHNLSMVLQTHMLRGPFTWARSLLTEAGKSGYGENNCCGVESDADGAMVHRLWRKVDSVVNSPMWKPFEW